MDNKSALPGLCLLALAALAYAGEAEGQRDVTFQELAEQAIAECGRATEEDVKACIAKRTHEHGSYALYFVSSQVSEWRVAHSDEIQKSRATLNAAAAQLERERSLQRLIASCRKRGISQETVKLGMTQEEVRACGWGNPSSINTTTTARGTHEQWVYDGRSYLYFQGNRLTAIQN